MSRSQEFNFPDVTKEMCNFNLKSKAKKERERERKGPSNPFIMFVMMMRIMIRFLVW